MFSRKNSDANSRRFWAWFQGEAHGLSNALEALVRHGGVVDETRGDGVGGDAEFAEFDR